MVQRNGFILLALCSTLTFVIVIIATTLLGRDNKLSAGSLIPHLVWETTRNCSSQVSHRQDTFHGLLGTVQASRRHTQRKACSSLGFYKSATYGSESLAAGHLRNIHVSEKHQTLMCLVPKVSSTSWVRVLLILEGALNHTDKLAPRQIVTAGKKHITFFSKIKKAKRVPMLRNYTTIIFVRNPYTRFLSAFRDRLETYPNRNLQHRRTFNKKIYTKFGNHSAKEMPPASVKSEMYNVTFKEFVDFYLSTGTGDVHWREQYKVCPPCVNYDFIGKIETYADDFNQILTLIDAESKVPFSNSGSKTGSSEDATLRQYYATLSKKQMEGLKRSFSTDMKLFGYSVPEALKDI